MVGDRGRWCRAYVRAQECGAEWHGYKECCGRKGTKCVMRRLILMKGKLEIWYVYESFLICFEFMLDTVCLWGCVDVSI